MAPGDQRRPRRSFIVTTSDERGRPLDTALARWLASVAPASARGSVNVAVVPDRRVRELNHLYRGKDYVTDVLSFPAGDPPHMLSGTIAAPLGGRRESTWRAASAAHLLGDIVIARGVARRQAREAGHTEATELRVLALHGLLHLLGYDHERDNGAMARVELRLRRKGRLPKGLIERQ